MDTTRRWTEPQQEATSIAVRRVQHFSKIGSLPASMMAMAVPGLQCRRNNNIPELYRPMVALKHYRAGFTLVAV